MNQRILIVDESEHFLEMIAIRLLNYGYENYFIAKNVQEAQEMIKEDFPDLVIIDTKLGDRDGFELCRKIKLDHGDNIKVILMTGLAQQYNLEKAQEVKADDYVVKTFDCLILMVAIKKLISEINLSHPKRF